MFVPSRYAEPKWQAYVTPSEAGFTFKSGRVVRSLFELKMALTEESEEVINQHVAMENHDLAAWVDNAVGDHELAEDMRRYKHRWGCIVALERRMMRTLSLPDYVAKRWLKAATYSFTFVSGQSVNSLGDLVEALKSISDETVQFHRERVPNDISKWLSDVLGDYLLAELLEEATNRLQMLHFAEDHYKMLQEAGN